MLPIVNGLEAEFGEQIKVERLDAAKQENADLMAEFGVRGHPTFVVVDADGQVQQTFVGPQTGETLRDALTAVTVP